ncbi:MAG: hypothetical protein JXA33_07730 [Anaerolineae bacterium]|nr:hypothetical protein [Anaerolineae bacterium]
MRKKLNYLGIMVTVLLIFIHPTYRQSGWAAPHTQEAIWTITSPAEGTIAGGEITIIGTASLPNFDSYGVLYASGPQPTANSQWVPIVFGERTMVVNGPLATWDTTALPNGQYTLALAVYEVGNTEPKLDFTNNITIFNEAATPTPEITETPTPTAAAEQPATAPGEEGMVAPVGPTVEQPPTVTPRPTATLAPVDPTLQEGEEEESLIPTILSMDSVKETFSTGVQLAILIYVFGGLYAAIKAAIRYYLRRRRISHPLDLFKSNQNKPKGFGESKQ